MDNEDEGAHHVDELGELEPEVDGERLGEVGDGADEPVVVLQQVVVQLLGVRVAAARHWSRKKSGPFSKSRPDWFL